MLICVVVAVTVVVLMGADKMEAAVEAARTTAAAEKAVALQQAASKIKIGDCDAGDLECLGKAAAEKAREELKKRSEETANKRRISLQGAPGTSSASSAAAPLADR